MLLVVAGCEPESQPGAAVEAPQPSPEARLEGFLSELRRRIEGGGRDGMPMAADGVTHSGDYQVLSHELIPPETASGLYRAWVEVGMLSNYSVLFPPEPEDEEAAPARRRVVADGDEDETEADAAELAGKAAGARRRAALAPPLKTVEHEDIRRFDLVYLDGKWVLKTSIGEDTPFLRAAFELAVSRQ